MRKEVIVIGAGGQGKVVADIFRLMRYRVSFVDDKIIGRTISDLPKLIGKRTQLFVAIGDNNVREKIVSRIVDIVDFPKFATAIHPSAVVSKDAYVGPGTCIMANAVVNSGCIIDPFSIINTGATIDHDGMMGVFSSLGPGVVCGGNVDIKFNSAVCIGAVVREGVLS